MAIKFTSPEWRGGGGTVTTPATNGVVRHLYPGGSVAQATTTKVNTALTQRDGLAPSAGTSGGGSGTGTSGGSSAGGSAGASAPAGSVLSAMLASIQQQRDAAYDRAVAAQKQNLGYAQQQLNDSTDRALREAYINRMQSQRNLQQQLTAQGLNGGASETTTASMLNNYGSARNALETERQRQLTALQQTYQNNLAQLDAQRAGGAAAALTELAPTLGTLAANNALPTVNLTQGSSDTAAMRYYLKQLGLLEEDE